MGNKQNQQTNQKQTENQNELSKQAVDNADTSNGSISSDTGAGSNTTGAEGGTGDVASNIANEEGTAATLDTATKGNTDGTSAPAGNAAVSQSAPTLDELKAAAKEVPETEAPVVTDVAPAVAEAKPFYEGHGLSRATESWLTRLQGYMVAMDPKLPMDPATGVPHQKTLYRTLTWVINSSPDEDFIKALSIILDQWAQNATGVFHESAVNRFPEHITLSDEERATFFQLLNLMSIGADSKGRQVRLKQLDFNRMFATIPLDQISEQGRQRILGFFGK